MTVTIPGYSSISGNPEAIIKLMQEARLFDSPTGDDYINCIVQAAWRCFGVALQITGDTYKERAECLLRELAKNNMIYIEEE